MNEGILGSQAKPITEYHWRASKHWHKEQKSSMWVLSKFQTHLLRYKCPKLLLVTTNMISWNPSIKWEEPRKYFFFQNVFDNSYMYSMYVDIFIHPQTIQHIHFSPSVFPSKWLINVLYNQFYKTDRSQ